VALGGVVAGGLVGGLGDSDGPGGGLEASGGEGTHLEVEAAAEPVLFSDQGVGGYYPVVEDDLEAVHAAVADGGYGPGLDCSPLRLGEVEGVSGEAGFLNDEQREA